MATNVMALSEYADMLQELADDWDDEDEPAVLIGELTGSLSVTAKDGYSTFGSVGYAQECFDGNGVMELQEGDTRFFGALLLKPENLAKDAQESLRATDWEPAAAGGDD